MARPAIRETSTVPVKRRTAAFLAARAAAALAAGASARLPPKPAPCPERWLGLLGKYGVEGKASSDFLIREDGGRLQIYDSIPRDLGETGRDSFLLGGRGGSTSVVFFRDSLGGGGACAIGGSLYARKYYPGERDRPPKPTVDLPLDSLWNEARKARPPREKGKFAKPDLVDVRRFDPGIRLALAYSSPRNSYGFPLYDRDVALLQRPAARALARANAFLRPMGFALQLSDAYRPWYVTKFLHLSANPQMRKFVASPNAGSHHNRGTAVDVTLVDLVTGSEADVGHLGGELSERAHSYYPGGTSLQRWHRLVLRTALRSQGFRGLRKVWWHYRYISRNRYGIINVPISKAAGTD